MRLAVRLAVRSALDAALFAAAGAALALVVGALGGRPTPVLGAAVAAAWLGGACSLGSGLGRDPRRALLGALLLGNLGACAGLLNGAHAEALLATGSLDGGLDGAGAAAAGAIAWPDCSFPALAALPCVFAAGRSRTGGGEQLAGARLLVPLLLFLGFVAVVVGVREGPASRGVRALAVVGLGLAAWSWGAGLLYGLGDLLLPVAPDRDPPPPPPDEGAAPAERGPP